MTTYKAVWRVIVAHKLYLLIYIVWMCAMMMFMSASVVFSNLSSDTVDSFSSARATVAVVNRDDSDSGRTLAGSLRKYLAASNDVLELEDRQESLQNAVATGYTDLIVIVPAGYADDFAQATTGDEDAPKLDTVTSYTSGAGTMAQMEINDFLASVRTNALADAGDVSVKTIANVSEDVAEDHQKTVSDGDNDIAVVSAGEKKRAPEATGFGFTVKTLAYLSFVSMTVIISLIIVVFNDADRRRRMVVSATNQTVINLQQILVCISLALALWVLYMALGLGLLAVAGADLSAITLSSYSMVGLSVLAVILTSAAFGFFIGSFNMGEQGINGVANTFGLVIMFTSGMAFTPSLMPAPMMLLGKMLPGWWYCISIDDALGIGTAASTGVSVVGWAQSLGLLLVFACAFVCLGLAINRLRIARKA